MRTAHIVTTPHEVGDRVLAICGKQHKVKTLWDDIPLEAPICRNCVTNAIHALDEADEVITKSRIYLDFISRRIVSMTDIIAPENGLILDGIAEAADDYRTERLDKITAKAEEKRRKQTCTCTWTSMENFEVDPDCPIHSEPVPVAPPLPEGDTDA